MEPQERSHTRGGYLNITHRSTQDRYGNPAQKLGDSLHWTTEKEAKEQRKRNEERPERLEENEGNAVPQKPEKLCFQVGQSAQDQQEHREGNWLRQSPWIWLLRDQRDP